MGAATATERKEWLTSAGEAADLVRATDWSATSLGALDGWPQSLRSAASICLSSRFPMLVMWGPELVMLYNDAYRPSLGDCKHPWAMGQSVRDCWREIWPIIGPLLESVLADGAPTWSEDQLLLMERHGYPEECYYTFSFSPLQDESGAVAGALATVVETTERLIGERRLRILHGLARCAAGVTSDEVAFARSTAELAAGADDIPFALIYSVEAGEARLMGRAGLPADSPAAPAALALDDCTASWPIAEVMDSGAPLVVDDVERRFGPWPTAAGKPPVTRVLLLPVPGMEGASRGAVLVAGISPRRPLDDGYHRFLALVAHHIGAAVAAARAHEEARARAALAERTAALAALQESEQRFRSLSACSPVGIFTSDGDGLVGYANPTLLEIAGLDPAEARGEGLITAIHPGDREPVGAAWRAAVASGRPMDVVTRLCNRHSGTRWVRIRTAPLLLDGRVVAGHVGTVADITEQRQVEEALRQAEFQYRELVEMSQAMVWRGVGEVPRLTFVNRRAAELSGIEVERWTSEPKLWVELVLPEDRDTVLRAIQRARHGPQEVEARMVAADGTIVCLRSFIRCLGETTAGPEFTGMMFDETELRRTREKAEESRTRLRELADRLRTVREHEQTRIAREIHDELGQSLTGLKMQLAWLAGRLPADSADLSVRAAEMLAQIDSTLEAVRRIATRLRPGVLDDLGLLAALEWLVHDFAKRTGVRCRLSLPPDASPAMEQHMTSVFRIAQEALTNVARHAGARSVAIVLRPDGDQCVLTVADDGRGMPAETENSQYSLGLLGMRERAIASGGMMAISSSPGNGTTVTARVGGARSHHLEPGA